jgi:hypothetical protein
MNRRRRSRVAALAALLLTAVAATVLVSGGVASARVSTTPAPTPELGNNGTNGSVELVRQMVQCGGTMYAVGTFSRVRNAGSSTLIVRHNAFAFSATAPYRVSSWNPDVSGQVDTVECTPDGQVLLGGSLTAVGGVPVRNLAKVDGVTGRNRGFGFQPKDRVAHVEVVTDSAGVRHALVGGFFTGLLKSVNPVTGASDGYGTPLISGTYSYPGVVAHGPRIWNMTVAPNGRAVLMTGVFTSVAGQRHEQVFRLNLTARSSTVSIWSPKDLYTKCVPTQPFYAHDAAWAPDMSQIYVATTGFRTAAEQALPASQRPARRAGPCDAVIGFTGKEGAFAGHRWINYTGCDSLYSVAADAQSVFVGGHQKFLNNGEVCGGTAPGPGGVVQAGLGAVDPVTGLHQPSANRARGFGATDLLRTSAGLWVSSDNFEGSSTCGGRSGHMGICFLPN